nr:hypothetical protein I308_04829 [Cryptococcus tetragattii IND107]
MPPKGQTQKDVPLSEDPNPVGIEDDFQASSLAQMQNAITYLSEVVSQQQQTLQSTLVAQPAPVPQATTVITHGYAPQDWITHSNTYSLLTPLDDPQQEENRHVSILEVANNSVECAGLLAWVDNIGQMMEIDGKSNWDEWIAAFKDAALPLHGLSLSKGPYTVFSLPLLVTGLPSMPKLLYIAATSWVLIGILVMPKWLWSTALLALTASTLMSR